MTFLMCTPQRRLDVKAVTDGVPGASYQGFKDWAEADAAYAKAHVEGKTKIVKLGPPPGVGPSGASAARSVSASGGCTQGGRKGARESRPTRQDCGVSQNRGDELQQQQQQSARPRSVQSPEARAARDAAIAETLEQLRRERQEQGSPRRSNQLERGGSFASSASISGNRKQASAPARTERPKPSSAPTPPPHAQGSRRAAGSRSSGTSEPSTSSSPPTGVTVLEHGSSASALSPRSTQSLSYWSDEPESPAPQVLRSPPMSISSEVTGSTFLSSADVRSDLSSPSSCGTRYFPEDYLSRVQAKRERAGTRPPEPVRNPTPVVPDVPVTPTAGASEHSTLFAPHEPMQSFASLATPRPAATSAPQPHPQTVSAPPAVRPRQTAKSYDDVGVQDDRHTARPRRADANVQTVEQRRFASAETQTSPALVLQLRSAARAGAASLQSGERCGCERPEWICRCCGLPPPGSPRPRSVMYSVTNRSSPASRSVSPASQACAMSIPSSARPWSPVLSPLMRSPRSFSPTFRPQSLSPSARASPKPDASVTSSPSSRSPIRKMKESAASSPASRSQSSGRSRSSSRSEATSYHTASPGAGSTAAVTPPLGPSETRTESIASMASVQEGVDMMARGAVPMRSPSGRASTVMSPRTRRRASGDSRAGGGSLTSTAAATRSPPPVLHDTTFDPRSPIQRGTMIPPGSQFDPLRLVRPSPTMQPLDSLLFS
ncbi:hypothetical protein C8Q70DRAFT_706225 [Cubamyces menziesii]|nr:hypothetical protein C8Q70DRAFT_706225 [Cubamyces menziesii]